MNGETDHTQNTNQGHASSQVETSSQEELSTLTSKRNPYNILPPEHQPKSKIANLSTTPNQLQMTIIVPHRMTTTD